MPYKCCAIKIQVAAVFTKCEEKTFKKICQPVGENDVSLVTLPVSVP